MISQYQNVINYSKMELEIEAFLVKCQLFLLV